MRYTRTYVIPQRRSTPCESPSISQASRTCPIATSVCSRKQSLNTLILNLSILPQDILLLVAEHADQRDRLNLCRASRSPKLACMPHIYRTVNLNTEGHAMIFGRIRDSDGNKPTDIQPSTQSKQERFLQTLLVIQNTPNTFSHPPRQYYHPTILAPFLRGVWPVFGVA